MSKISVEFTPAELKATVKILGNHKSVGQERHSLDSYDAYCATYNAFSLYKDSKREQIAKMKAQILEIEKEIA
jgi:hypothetical protein